MLSSVFLRQEGRRWHVPEAPGSKWVGVERQGRGEPGGGLFSLPLPSSIGMGALRAVSPVTSTQNSAWHRRAPCGLTLYRLLHPLPGAALKRGQREDPGAGTERKRSAPCWAGGLQGQGRPRSLSSKGWALTSSPEMKPTSYSFGEHNVPGSCHDGLLRNVIGVHEFCRVSRSFPLVLRQVDEAHSERKAPRAFWWGASPCTPPWDASAVAFRQTFRSERNSQCLTARRTRPHHANGAELVERLAAPRRLKNHLRGQGSCFFFWGVR